MIDREIENFLNDAHLKLLSEISIPQVPAMPSDLTAMQIHYNQAYNTQCKKHYSYKYVDTNIMFKLLNNTRTPTISIYTQLKPEVDNVTKNSNSMYPYKFSLKFTPTADLGKEHVYTLVMPFSIGIGNTKISLPAVELRVKLLNSTPFGYLVSISTKWKTNLPVLPAALPKAETFYIKYGTYKEITVPKPPEPIWNEDIHHVMPERPPYVKPMPSPIQPNQPHVLPIRPPIPYVEPDQPHILPVRPISTYGAKSMVIYVKDANGIPIPGINISIMVNRIPMSKVTDRQGIATFVIQSNHVGGNVVGAPSLSDPNHKYTTFKLTLTTEKRISVNDPNPQLFPSAYHYTAYSDYDVKPIEPAMKNDTRKVTLVLHNTDNAEAELYSTTSAPYPPFKSTTTLVKKYALTNAAQTLDLPLHSSDFRPMPLGATSASYWLKIYKNGYMASKDGKKYADYVSISYEPQINDSLFYPGNYNHDTVKNEIAKINSPLTYNIYFSPTAHVLPVNPVKPVNPVIPKPKQVTSTPKPVQSQNPPTTANTTSQVIAANPDIYGQLPNYGMDTIGGNPSKKQSNMLTYVAIGGALLVLVYMLKK